MPRGPQGDDVGVALNDDESSRVLIPVSGERVRRYSLPRR